MKKIHLLWFIFFVLSFFSCSSKVEEDFIMTVKGPVPASQMGMSLVHEHILVDFIGADMSNKQRWNVNEVTTVVLPYLKVLTQKNCRTFVECTPAYLGRDPELLKILADSTRLNIITNTGYYGAVNNKYLPAHAYTETAEQISQRWIDEWKNGIDGTGIRPGFIKISVNPESLSDLHKKLVVAAAKTHLATGLTIASHTGLAVPAFEQLEVIKEEGVSPEAFIWVHAQAEKNYANHLQAAQMGAWISLDGLSDRNVEEYVIMIQNLRKNNLLNKVLLSHDAGWYDVDGTKGEKFRGYTALFEVLLPRLIEENFSQDEINQILVLNPAKAFSIRVRHNI